MSGGRAMLYSIRPLKRREAMGVMEALMLALRGLSLGAANVERE